MKNNLIYNKAQLQDMHSGTRLGKV